MKRDVSTVRVIYVMSAGRSGSTVLDTILGNHPAVESVGELTNLAYSGWLNGEYCACGQRGNVCPFWSEVRQEWAKQTGADDVTGYLALQSKFERFRRWPQLLREERGPSTIFQAYSQQTQNLFKAIQMVSGKSLIVDSSKNPVRAFALSLMPEIDLYLIHLIRDGRGVAWSLKKAYKKDERAGVQRDFAPRPVWRTTVFWITVNLLATWVRHKLNHKKSIQVRYEDFVVNPREKLVSIGQLIGLEFTQVAEAVENGTALPVGHTIAGNRLRMAGSVRLKADTEWMQKLPTNDQRLFWIMAGWLMRRYDYQR